MMEKYIQICVGFSGGGILRVAGFFVTPVVGAFGFIGEFFYGPSQSRGQRTACIIQIAN